MFQSLSSAPKVLAVDIGGFTADYLFIKQGKAQLWTCVSLENGVIVHYNRIRARINADYDMLLEEGDIDAILRGRGSCAPDIAILVEQETPDMPELHVKPDAMEQEDMERLVIRILEEMGYSKAVPGPGANATEVPGSGLEAEYDRELGTADMAAIADSLAAFRGI